ncbi:MAG: sigma-70 family RNA polymerase sigma factor [Flavitalea sp.]
MADFKHLYEEYHTKLYFFVLKHTQSPFIAEETVQLSFIKIWEKADQLSENVSLSVQIFRIAKSVMIDLLRKETVRTSHTELFATEKKDYYEQSDMHNRQELLRVHNAINQMAPVRKKVFMLSRLEGLSHSKIAEHLSISPKTVENHIGKAIRELRRTLTSFLSL